MEKSAYHSLERSAYRTPENSAYRASGKKSYLEKKILLDILIDRATVGILAGGIANGRGVVEYDEAVDMSDYDIAFTMVGGE